MKSYITNRTFHSFVNQSLRFFGISEERGACLLSEKPIVPVGKQIVQLISTRDILQKKKELHSELVLSLDFTETTEIFCIINFVRVTRTRLHWKNRRCD